MNIESIQPYIEPLRRFVITWHPGRDPQTAQEVEVTFTAAGRGTRVELEHRNWQAYGAGAADARGGYENGWQKVLGEYYAEECARAAV